MGQERFREPDNIGDLVREIGEGSREAFMTIVKAYQQRVFITAFSICRNREDALDIVQETFLRLHQKAGLFKQGNSFQGWLLQITKNLCIDHYRKNVKNKKEFESPASLDDLRLAAPPDPSVSPAAELKDVFARCIDKLAGRQRMVFVMRHINELRYDEISETMNISVGTVKSLHFKAVQNLRKLISPYMGVSS
jgi:RNA polymerase sigma-70 factor, ECF subfamily